MEIHYIHFNVVNLAKYLYCFRESTHNFGKQGNKNLTFRMELNNSASQFRHVSIDSEAEAVPSQ